MKHLSGVVDSPLLKHQEAPVNILLHAELNASSS